MDHETMMLECIKQATAQGLKGDEARAEAKRMFNQITGRTEERGDKIETPMATIHRKPPFLDDYKPE